MMRPWIDRYEPGVLLRTLISAKHGSSRSGSDIAIALLPVTIAALLAAFIPAIRDRFSETWASALWGLLLLFAFVGWGRLVNHWHRPLAMRDWGLDGAVGMACFLWVGAVLAIFHLVGPVAIWGMVFGGIGAHAYDRLREPPRSGLYA